jgi:hypothetical protein
MADRKRQHESPDRPCVDEPGATVLMQEPKPDNSLKSHLLKLIRECRSVSEKLGARKTKALS